MIEQEMQEKYYEMQLYESEHKKVQERLKELEEQMEELDGIQENLTQFEQLKKGDELLVPLANGIFCKARLEDTSELRVNIGAGVNINKDVKSTITLLDGHKAEIAAFKEKVVEKLLWLNEQQEKIHKEIVALTEAYEKKNHV